jgi:hypothetical protein
VRSGPDAGIELKVPSYYISDAGVKDHGRSAVASLRSLETNINNS